MSRQMMTCRTLWAKYLPRCSWISGMSVTAHIPQYDPCEVCSPRHCCGAVDCKAERGVPPRACHAIHHPPRSLLTSSQIWPCKMLSPVRRRVGERTGNECLASGLSVDPSMQAQAFHSTTLGQLRVGSVKQRMRPGQIPLPIPHYPRHILQARAGERRASTSFWHVCCACLIANQSVEPSTSWPPACSLPSPVAR